VGPRRAKNQYQWAIVSDVLRTSLWVLSRTPDLPAADAADVIAWTDANGFDKPWNMPVATPHSADCVYPAE
jgi:lipocalin